VKFTIIHPTARVTNEFANPWWRAHDSALNGCDSPRDVEYIIVVHESRAKAFRLHDGPFHSSFGRFTVVINYGRDCLVDQCNAGQAAMTGEILVGNQDDMRYPEHWDTEIAKLIPDTSKLVCVLAKHDGREDLFTLPTIITKTLADEIGPISPEYDGMFSDDEFSLKVQSMAQALILSPLYFQHLHPVNGTAELDEVYQKENREEAYRVGKEVFELRKAQGFPRVELPGFPAPPSRFTLKVIDGTKPNVFSKALDWIGAKVKPGRAVDTTLPRPVRDMAILVPGESHPAEWELPFFGLLGELSAEGWRIEPRGNFSTNVYGTRIVMTDELLATGVEYDRVLWIDDDNPLTGAQAVRMSRYLDEHPEVDGIVAWCWIRMVFRPRGSKEPIELFITSCGNFADNGINMRPMEYSELVGENMEVKPIEASGFPAFMLRFSVVKQLGREAFAPIFHPDCTLGFSGEDMAFFHNAKKAGFKFVVDPAIEVPHLKRRASKPDIALHPDMTEEELKSALSYREGANGPMLHVSQKAYELMEANKV
jgi:hypothetical protein